jgi:ABC-type transport system substrate-binding protein
VDGEPPAEGAAPFHGPQRRPALAIDRKRIVEQLYGKTGEVACSGLHAEEVHTGSHWQKDSAAANQLDEAGWGSGDGIHTKDGVRMKVLFRAISQPARTRRP